MSMTAWQRIDQETDRVKPQEEQIKEKIDQEREARLVDMSIRSRQRIDQKAEQVRETRLADMSIIARDRR